MTSFESEDRRREFLQELFVLRRHGKEWGLCEAKIDNLFLASEWIPPDSTLRVVYRTTLKVCTRLLVCTTICLCALIFFNQAAVADDLFSKRAPDFSFHILRFSRKFGIASGLSSWLSSRGFYSANCLMDNPLYEDAPLNCSRCIDGNIEEIRITDDGQSVDIKNMSALVVRSPGHSHVSLVDLQRAFRPHIRDCRTHSKMFFSSRESLGSIEAFLNEDDVEGAFTNQSNKPAFLIWRVNHYNVSRHFRPLFPRAPFVPPHAEVRLDKAVFAYDRRHHEFQIITDHLEKAWIFQSRFSRCFTLYPPSRCHPGNRQRRRRKRKEGTDFEDSGSDNGDDDSSTALDQSSASDETVEDVASNAGGEKPEGEDERGDGRGDDIDISESHSGVNSDVESTCAPVHLRLNPGDFLYLQGRFWEAVSKPCSNDNRENEDKVEDGYAITYVGSFQ